MNRLPGLVVLVISVVLGSIAMRIAASEHLGPRVQMGLFCATTGLVAGALDLAVRAENRRTERHWPFAPAAGIHIFMVPLWMLGVGVILSGLGVWTGVVPINEHRPD